MILGWEVSIRRDFPNDYFHITLEDEDETIKTYDIDIRRLEDMIKSIKRIIKQNRK